MVEKVFPASSRLIKVSVKLIGKAIGTATNANAKAYQTVDQNLDRASGEVVWRSGWVAMVKIRNETC